MTRNNILLLIALIVFYSCGDNVELKESDLKKYSWLTPFCDNSLGVFSGGSHNLDLGQMEFNYELSATSNRNIIYEMDSIAITQQWKVLEFTTTSITMTKLVSYDVKDGGTVHMNIKFDPLTNMIVFNIK